jgi:acetyl-CoA/propionyl-CoA carboxylase biotin carboxyl carrier protein
VRYDVEGVTVTVAGRPEDALVAVADAEARPAGLRLRAAERSGEPDVALLDLDGRTIRFDTARDGSTVWLARDGRARPLRLRDRATRLADRLAGLDRADAAAHPELRSPMPGTVVAVAVEPGARVDAGDTVVVVEAMKMEHRLVAPVAGTVTVHVAQGDLVRLDQVVARVDADDADAASGASGTPGASTASTPVPPEEADAEPTRSAAAQR